MAKGFATCRGPEQSCRKNPSCRGDIADHWRWYALCAALRVSDHGELPRIGTSLPCDLPKLLARGGRAACFNWRFVTLEDGGRAGTRRGLAAPCRAVREVCQRRCATRDTAPGLLSYNLSRCHCRGQTGEGRAHNAFDLRGRYGRELGPVAMVQIAALRGHQYLCQSDRRAGPAARADPGFDGGAPRRWAVQV